MRDFHNAIGQYSNYKVLMQEQEATRSLYLAVPKKVFDRRFTQQGVEFICQKMDVSIVVFDEKTETIEQWKR
jgi:XisH protein